MRESPRRIDLNLALQSGALPGFNGGQQVACQVFDLHLSNLWETKTRVFNRNGKWGGAQNQLPRCVLAEDFLDDVIALKCAFDLVKGEHLQGWDLVLRKDTKFEHHLYEIVGLSYLHC